MTKVMEVMKVMNVTRSTAAQRLLKVMRKRVRIARLRPSAQRALLPVTSLPVASGR
jgi:hypothetical protein